MFNDACTFSFVAQPYLEVETNIIKIMDISMAQDPNAPYEKKQKNA